VLQFDFYLEQVFMSIKQLKYQRLLAMVFAGASLGIAYFWWQFFNGELFLIEELKPLIKNFDGYYDREKSFVVPDAMLAFGLMVSAFLLWFDFGGHRRTILAAASSGAALFLGVLDLSAGFSTGLYVIAHPYANEVLSFDLSITAVGIVGLSILLFQK
jgi:hypothetical protein